MKKIYEKFEEIADDITDGYSIAHAISDHNPGACIIWQEAIGEFARALDLGGFTPNGSYEELWDNVTSAFRKWDEYGHGEIEVETRKAIHVEITQKDAEEAFGKFYEKGHKVVMPLLNSNPEIVYRIV